jgi:hypothetical protein
VLEAMRIFNSEVRRATKLGPCIEVQKLTLHTSDGVVPVISAANHKSSTFVQAPEVPVDDPDRSARCQNAMQIAFQNMAERAMAAGWREQEVAAALWSILLTIICSRSAPIRRSRKPRKARFRNSVHADASFQMFVHLFAGFDFGVVHLRVTQAPLDFGRRA